MQKSPTVYRIILAAWAVLTAVSVYPLSKAVWRETQVNALAGAMAAICTVFVLWFWLNGIKDLVYTTFFHLRKQELLRPVPTRTATTEPEVVLVYCTCNDFDEDSLLASMQQNYHRYHTVILDDSSRPESIAAVDRFSSAYGVPVVRREDRRGFKAGNLNNYLTIANYDFFVILDSDEIIPPDFVSRALDYFASDPAVGIVQANHVATRNENEFMQRFAPGVDAHWPAYQAVKDRHGFLSLLGHGAMISRECYQAAGGFPHVVAEDLCFSIRARTAGYRAAFASDIVCSEAYPVNYLAFKKRHSKWTQGNMEFIKRYTREIMRSPLTWFEKLDIVLFTYSLPLTFCFFAYMLINVAVLPLDHTALHYPGWMLAPTILFLLAPMLNDILTYRRKWTPQQLISYSLHTMGLYGSMFLTSLRASAKSLFGRSVFIVTPKDQHRLRLSDALRANVPELAFAAVLLTVTRLLNGTIWPCILVSVTAVSSVWITLMSNRASSRRRTPVMAVPLPMRRQGYRAVSAGRHRA